MRSRELQPLRAAQHTVRKEAVATTRQHFVFASFVTLNLPACMCGVMPVRYSQQNRCESAATASRASGTTMDEFAVLWPAQRAAGQAALPPAKGWALLNAAPGRYPRRRSCAASLEQLLASLVVSLFVRGNDRCREDKNRYYAGMLCLGECKMLMRQKYRITVSVKVASHLQK